MKKVLLFLSILGMVSIISFAAGTTPVSTPASAMVVAMVNGEAIHANILQSAANIGQTLMAIRKVNPKMYQLLLSSKAGTDFLKAYNRAVLDDLVNSVLMEQIAFKDYNIKVTEKEALNKVKEQVAKMLASYNITKEQFSQYLQSQGYGNIEQFEKSSIFTVKFSMTVELLRKAVTSSATVSNEEIKQYYNANINAFRTPMQINVEHIMLNSEATANKVLKEIKSNAITFESAAAKYSLDVQTRNKNGDIGWIPESKNMPSYEIKLFNANIEDIIGPVKTSYGWELFKVIGKKSASIKSLAEASQEIKNTLLSKKREKLWNDWLNGVFKKFKSNSKIKIMI